MRKSHLLTTLTAVLLLAATAGTASAQSPRIGFTPRSGSVNEGARADANSEHPLLTVTVRARGLPAGPAGQGADGQPTARQQAIDALGEITIETEGIGRREAATLSPVYDTPAALDEDAVFAASDTFPLTIDPVQDADSHNDEFSLRLRSTESIDTGARYRGTVIDDDPLATATFSRTDIRVFEGSEAQLSVRVAAPEGESFPTQAGDQNIVLKATPSGAVDVAECPTEGERGHALRIWSETETLSFNRLRGAVTIDKSIANYQRGPADLRLAACGDMSDFRDLTVTLAFRESSLQTPAGRIADGPPVVIQILNDDPLPSVSLSTPALTIDEGMTETVAIIAAGDLADAVMRVGVRVTGDALLSLLQDGNGLRASGGGAYTVELDVNGSAVLTIRADGDGSLTDNQTKTATLTIVDAGGADIGDQDTLLVTVRGSTAVPALSVVGQLLLALLLVAGGGWLQSRRWGAPRLVIALGAYFRGGIDMRQSQSRRPAATSAAASGVDVPDKSRAQDAPKPESVRSVPPAFYKTLRG